MDANIPNDVRFDMCANRCRKPKSAFFHLVWPFSMILACAALFHSFAAPDIHTIRRLFRVSYLVHLRILLMGIEDIIGDGLISSHIMLLMAGKARKMRSNGKKELRKERTGYTHRQMDCRRSDYRVYKSS